MCPHTHNVYLELSPCTSSLLSVTIPPQHSHVKLYILCIYRRGTLNISQSCTVCRELKSVRSLHLHTMLGVLKETIMGRQVYCFHLGHNYVIYAVEKLLQFCYCLDCAVRILKFTSQFFHLMATNEP